MSSKLVVKHYGIWCEQFRYLPRKIKDMLTSECTERNGVPTIVLSDGAEALRCLRRESVLPSPNERSRAVMSRYSSDDGSVVFFEDKDSCSVRANVSSELIRAKKTLSSEVALQKRLALDEDLRLAQMGWGKERSHRFNRQYTRDVAEGFQHDPNLKIWILLQMELCSSPGWRTLHTWINERSHSELDSYAAKKDWKLGWFTRAANFIKGVKMENSTFPAELHIFKQLMKGLKYIHEEDGNIAIVHRDLKPDNIFIQQSESYDVDKCKIQVKIGDFGLAQAVMAITQDESPSGKTENVNTLTTEPKGTFLYMAPDDDIVGAVESSFNRPWTDVSG
eukprot:GHVN01047154.1.p1 GENE.GHVN01047154.1~~GHVN01047154.1.p1  ORF type:complete len:335 (+),score=44.44 GHVN01047154.1:53-1057(+)